MRSAYKVIKLEYEPNPRFNFSSDEEVSTLLEPYLDRLDKYGNGYDDVSTETLKELLDEAKTEKAKQQLQQMIKESEKDGYIAFYVF